MDTKLYEEYQEKLLDYQKEFLNKCLENVDSVKLSETYEKSIDFQEKLVKNYLDVQQTTTELFLSTQKKLWDEYFTSLRKEVTPAKV